MRTRTRFNKAIGELRQASISAPEGLLIFPPCPKKRWGRPAGIIAGGTVAAAVLAAFLMPASAIGLEEIGQALQSVPASYARFYSRGELRQECWKEGKKRRYSHKGFSPGSRNEYNYEGGRIDGIAWYVQPAQGYAVFNSDSTYWRPDSGPSLEDEVNSMTRRSKFKPLVEDRHVVVDGKELLEVTVRKRDAEGNPANTKSVYLCRLEDKLPIRVEYSSVLKGKEVVYGYWTIEYPDDIPDERFKPAIPKGLPVLDHPKALDQMRSRLHDPRYEKVVNGVTIKFLGIFAEIGDTVSVLYAGGEAPSPDARAGILNERGEGYRVYSEFESDDRSRPRNNGISKLKTGSPKHEKKKYHGISPDFPLDVRPFLYIDGTPIYCLEAAVEPAVFKNPTRMTAIVPVVKGTGKRITKGVYVRGSGKQVGVAKFEDMTVSVLVVGFLVRDLDKKRLPSSTSLPLQSINVDPKLQKQRELDRMRRH
jgi:hypothetical protein